nr:ribonuclease H-like domain-containing protein [Tanacetum cinerariifolium]
MAASTPKLTVERRIDSAFARFNTIITSLKALDECYSSKNYVRKFLRALHPKWRKKVTTIEESKDLTSLSLDELIRNLRVYEIIIKKDFEIVKAKAKRKSLALKAKKESSNEECSTFRSEDEEYAMTVRDFKKFFKRGECPKPPKDKNQRAFVGGFWSDSGEEDDEKVSNETCLVAQASSKRNKADLDTMSMNDLYNNLKVYKPEDKQMSSLSLSTQNMAFVSSSNNNISSTNGAVNTAHRVSTASTQVNAAYSINIDNLRDAVIFLISPMWSATTATREDILLESEELQENKATRTRKAQEAKEGPNYALMAFSSLGSNSEIVDNCKKGLGYENYNAVPHPYAGIFMPPTHNLSFTVLDEFVNKPVVKNYKAKSSEEEPKVVRKNDDALIIKECVSDNEKEDVSQPKIERKIVRPSIAKIEFVKSKQQEKTARKTVKQGHPQMNLQDRGMIDSRCSRNMSYLTDYKEIDGGYVAFGGNPKGGKIIRKSKYIVLSPNFKLIAASQVLLRVSRKNNIYSVDLKNIVPKGGLTCLFAKAISDESRLWPKAVVNTTRLKAVLNAVKGNEGNPQIDLGVIDSGCSRHMTGNMSYLTDYDEIDGGYVAFGGNPKGGKITGKGKINIGELDFENVYFVKELKFNLFSVSHDKKNSVLFNDTECVALSLDFKLTDENHVLLRVPRKNNMYSVDLKNIIPKGGLTYLFTKATSDESRLWHRRLGHLNFKTMNKLVKGNLVR